MGKRTQQVLNGGVVRLWEQSLEDQDRILVMGMWPNDEQLSPYTVFYKAASQARYSHSLEQPFVSVWMCFGRTSWLCLAQRWGLAKNLMVSSTQMAWTCLNITYHWSSSAILLFGRLSSILSKCMKTIFQMPSLNLWRRSTTSIRKKSKLIWLNLFENAFYNIMQSNVNSMGVKRRCTWVNLLPLEPRTLALRFLQLPWNWLHTFFGR